LYCICIGLISCSSTISENNTLVEIPEEISHDGNFQFFTSDKIEELLLYETPVEYSFDLNSYTPVIETLLFNAEPIDPILHLINLKKKYFVFNNLDESVFSSNEVSSIFADSHSYYTGTIRGAVFQSQIQENRNFMLKKPYNSIVNRSITGLVKLENVLFITSYNSFYSYNTETQELINQSEELPGVQFTALCLVEDSLFLGTSRGKLYRWDIRGFNLLTDLNDCAIKTIKYLNYRVFIGTSGKGLFEYDRQKERCFSLTDTSGIDEDIKISNITIFDNKFWINATDKGLYTFNLDLELKSGKLVNKENWILCSAQSENFIYFGTYNDGILFYDRIKKVWGSWGLRNGLSSLYIPSLYFLDNNLYISTPDKGIVIINEKIHEQHL
jgi:ligand-binding sensor domain-containing protein